MIKIDPIDLKILDAVQRDGRITKLALAEKIGLSPTPAWLRLRKLEKAGLVSGYKATLDIRSIAPIALVLVEITLRAHRQVDFDRFERAVRDVPEIISCWAVGGGLDYMLKVIVRDVDTYQRLMDDLLEREIGIERYFTYIVTRTVKDDAPIPVTGLVG